MNKKYRILVINKFFYDRGGDCIYSKNLVHLLEHNQHTVAVFAMQFPENNISEWDRYFAKEISFSQNKIKDKLLAILRLMGLGNIKHSYIKLLDDFKPDIVHLNNIHSYLSPIVAKLAHERGIKVVWTLHDYKLICPAYTCLRRGKTCEKCLRNLSAVVINKCMKENITASVIAFLEAKRWNRKSLENYVDSFICPSYFMANKIAQGKYDENKINVLHNFISINEVDKKQELLIREQAYCYIGRLSEEKGIGQLLKVASSLPYKLYIAGDGPLKEELEEKYSDERIIFLGKLTPERVVELLRRVQYSIIPSIWFENNPLSVIESLCLGTPVLGADIGGIPELINKTNGDLFKPDDLNDLKEKIIFLFEKRSFNYEMIRNEAISHFSSENYYSKLIKIYSL